MRVRWLILGVALLAVASLGVGCRAKRLAERAPTAGPMPPNTVMLSAMMQELARQPGFVEAFLREVQGGGRSKAGAALLTPGLLHDLRDRILGGDWQGLDRFPGWTMREINPTVRVVGHVAGKDQAVENSATAGGAPGSRPAAATALTFVDLGDFKPGAQGRVDFDEPARGPGFVTADYVSALGDGVVRGDGPNLDRAARHASSARLADALNRLSLNGESGMPRFEADVRETGNPAAEGYPASSPQELVAALQRSGHTVEVVDSRYFANFGHLHFKGQDVMMPFWVNPQVLVPGTRRPLLVPVSHAEYEWFVRGPRVNAEVSFYFGIDGKAEWRTMDQQDQPWVMNRHAHTYSGADALEVTRLAGAMVRTYLHLHQSHPAMPFGGYYAFGVCQDVVAAIEWKLNGKTTLYPNTADESFFTDPSDAEINGLIRHIPKDRDGKPPGIERIFGSLPVGESDSELASVSVPGLGPDLVAVHDAWTAGTLTRVQTGWRKWVKLLYPVGLAAFLLACWVRYRTQRPTS